VYITIENMIYYSGDLSYLWTSQWKGSDRGPCPCLAPRRH